MQNNQIWIDFMKSMHRMGILHANYHSKVMTKNEFFVLGIISHANEKENTQAGIYVSDISDKMKCSQPATSRTLRGLEEKGYIERTVNKADRRNTRVTMTELGENQRKKMYSEMQDIMQRVINKMGEEEMKQFLALWNKFTDAIQEEMQGKKI